MNLSKTTTTTTECIVHIPATTGSTTRPGDQHGKNTDEKKLSLLEEKSQEPPTSCMMSSATELTSVASSTWWSSLEGEGDGEGDEALENDLEDHTTVDGCSCWNVGVVVRGGGETESSASSSAQHHHQNGDVLNVEQAKHHLQDFYRILLQQQEPSHKTRDETGGGGGVTTSQDETPRTTASSPTFSSAPSSTCSSSSRSSSPAARSRLPSTDDLFEHAFTQVFDPRVTAVVHPLTTSEISVVTDVNQRVTYTCAQDLYQKYYLPYFRNLGFVSHKKNNTNNTNNKYNKKKTQPKQVQLSSIRQRKSAELLNQGAAGLDFTLQIPKDSSTGGSSSTGTTTSNNIDYHCLVRHGKIVYMEQLLHQEQREDNRSRAMLMDDSSETITPQWPDWDPTGTTTESFSMLPVATPVAMVTDGCSNSSSTRNTNSVVLNSPSSSFSSVPLAPQQRPQSRRRPFPRLVLSRTKSVVWGPFVRRRTTANNQEKQLPSRLLQPQ